MDTSMNEMKLMVFHCILYAIHALNIEVQWDQNQFAHKIRILHEIA